MVVSYTSIYVYYITRIFIDECPTTHAIRLYCNLYRLNIHGYFIINTRMFIKSVF